MTRRRFAQIVAAAVGGATRTSFAHAQEPDAMREYVDRIRSDLTRFSSEQPGLVTEAGERLAERVAAGGRLLIYDRRGPYSSEAAGRAGGLMAIHRVRAGEGGTISSEDGVIMVADEPAHPTDLTMARAAREARAFVVGICPVRSAPDALSRVCDLALDNYVTDADAAITIDGMDAPIAPTSGVLNTAILWTLTAAYIESMERRGKPPHVWMSIKRPGAKEFNAAALEATKEAGY